MSGCTAKLKVDGQTVTCVDHDDLSRYPHSTGPLAWGDEAPGATPATKYRASPFGTFGGWRVENERGHAAASFHGSEHPDARGAAEAEAARLNGDDPSHEDWQQAVLHQQQAVRERDAARLRANSYKDRALDAEAERDRYLDALKRLVHDHPFVMDGDNGAMVASWFVTEARTALYGGGV